MINDLVREQSTAKLARKSGLDEKTIYKIKRNHPAKVTTMLKILNALEVDVESDPIEDLRTAIKEREYSLYVISKISGVPVSTIENFIYSNKTLLWHNMVALGQALDVKFYKSLEER
jgi:predicted transcriptional regulator